MNRSYRESDEFDVYTFYYVDNNGRLMRKRVTIWHDRNYDANVRKYERMYAKTQDEALKRAGIFRSKFDPKKFIKKENGKWVPAYPFGNDSVDNQQS